MKRISLIALIGMTMAMHSIHATQQNLSFSGPPIWTPGTSITLVVTDFFSGFGPGSYGLSYWFEVSTALAPFLTITDITYFTFTDPNNIGTFPFSFNSTSGADNGFMTTTTADGLTGDLGGTSQPFNVIPSGVYHVTNIAFALATNAPAGTYTLRTTTASPRASIQVTSDFNDAPFPQASFVFNVVPEPSTLALIAMTGMGAGMMLFRRRK